MPSSEVFNKYKSGTLRSGSKSGPVVKNRAQAIAIKMSEERNEYETGSAHQARKKPRRRPRA